MANDPISTAGIFGTDGKTPIYNPNASFHIWGKHEIYLGGVGENKYVPKVGDLVIDRDLIIYYEVNAIDAGTLIPDLIERTPVISDGSLEGDDVLLGVGPGTQSDTYRIYIDKSTIPHTLTVDARLKVNGVLAQSCKIYVGSDLTNDANIISAYYDNVGTLLSRSIPLEIVSVNQSVTNRAVKSVPVCYTSSNLTDGDIVTAVFYSAAGHVISKRQLLVENTAYIRQANSSIKYITGISLRSPFLSVTDPRLLQLPLNALIDGIGLTGVVHYSDGSTLEYGVDGTKFTVLGMDNYAATVVNQQIPIVLRYRLSNNESAVGAVIGQEQYLTETYRIKTIQSDGSYSVKLFCYPVWQNAVDGYRLTWFMYNGDRQNMYDVTGLVEYSSNAAAFDPLGYGINQRLTVALNLKAVNGLFANYRHVQTIELILWNQGTERSTNWGIIFETGQNPAYGINNRANLTVINSNFFNLRVDTGAANLTEWLERLYYRTKPLIDQVREQTPPEPTHFRIKVGLQEIEFPISQWNQDLVIGNGITNNSTLLIKFIKKTPDTTLHLAIAGIPVYQTV